jgi:hypothetical protein
VQFTYISLKFYFLYLFNSKKMKTFPITIILISMAFSCNKDSEIAGCMDATATNFNSEATVDNGSCAYPPPPPLTEGPFRFHCNYVTLEMAPGAYFEFSTDGGQNFVNYGDFDSTQTNPVPKVMICQKDSTYIARAVGKPSTIYDGCWVSLEYTATDQVGGDPKIWIGSMNVDDYNGAAVHIVYGEYYDTSIQRWVPDITLEWY